MGLPSTSRKGKKAWRKNIDDSEIVEVIQKQTHQERRGPAVETIPDHELFFVDKGDSGPAVPLATKRAKAKREPRPTRAQLILSAPQSIKPVTSYKAPPRKDHGLPPPRQQQLSKVKAGAIVAVPDSQRKAPPASQQPDSTDLDLWQGEDDALLSSEPGDDAPASPQPAPLKPVGPTSRGARKGRRPALAPRIAAVEVDMAGCSYNPERESHQDALAVLVATENKKLLKKELGPKAVPLQVDVREAGPIDELDRLLTDADGADDAEIPLDEEEQEEEEVEVATGRAEQSSGKPASTKKTKKDRNRAARAAAEAKALEAKKALKRQRRELQQLPQLAAEVEEEEQYRELKRARRQVVAEEKAASQPPRLGKLKFEDLSVQVLTSDEVGQGLRRLKAFPMLATERFKSLQKRGLIEPRKPVGARGPKKVIVYEKGARREKALEGQAELEAIQKANRSKKKALQSL